MLRTPIFIILYLYAVSVLAQAFVRQVTVDHTPQGLQMDVFLTEETRYHLFGLQKPERVILDLEHTSQKGKIWDFPLEGSPIHKIRFGVQKGHHLRIVFDMKKAVIPVASFVKKGAQGACLRLMWPQKGISVPFPREVKPVPSTKKATLHRKGPKVAGKSLKHRPFVIALDPGHGGVDPGAIGVRGSKEKKIVLEIARRIKKRLDTEPDMRAVLIRDGDYFIPLRRRMEIARKHHADLFVSIHADAFHQPSAYGASVFVVSKRGASSEAARWLADIENKADLLGGGGIDHRDTVLASVLLDLSQTASNAASMEIAKEVLKEMSRVTSLHKNKVEQAGFVVLKSPDIPSILVETGFISNKKGEARLNSAAHQEELALAVSRAIKQYFRKKPRPLLQPMLE